MIYCRDEIKLDFYQIVYCSELKKLDRINVKVKRYAEKKTISEGLLEQQN